MQPMEQAPKDGSPMLAKFRSNLVEIAGRDTHNIRHCAGAWVVVRHTGISDSGYDLGWALAGPFGMGGWPDSWFEGFEYLPDDPRAKSEAKRLGLE